MCAGPHRPLSPIPGTENRPDEGQTDNPNLTYKLASDLHPDDWHVNYEQMTTKTRHGQPQSKSHKSVFFHLNFKEGILI